MTRDERTKSQVADCDALEAAWPRALIAAGSARALAVWWVACRSKAIDEGLPPFARHPITPAIVDGLFHARRARRLVRGLEGATAALEKEEAGLRKTAASQARSESIRISRLLVVSLDGSSRFFRQVEGLRERFANRLEVLVLDCDEAVLGASAYGPGRRARALLIDHREAVVRFLELLERDDREPSRSQSN